MARHHLRHILPSLALALWAAPARAQVNTEALRSDLDTHPRYLAVQASFAGHVGNTNGAVGSAAGFAGARFGRHLLFLKLQGDYAEFSGTTTISSAFAHARYGVRFLPFLFGEAFVQFEENVFQRLALRQLDGVGVRLGVLQLPDLQLFYGSAWMLDYEKLNDDPLPVGTFVGAHWWAQRWSNYVAVSWKLNGRARLSDTLYVQPRFNAFSDVRVLNDSAFVLDIDKRFSAKVECQIHHNNAPPSRVVPTDVDTITSLVLTL